jgi:transcriptional regulator with XRE-family HTH domain
VEAAAVTAELELRWVVPNTPWELAARYDGARLREQRLAAGYGVRRFAKALGTVPGRISRWERNLGRPGQYHAEQIIQLLGIQPEDLCRPADE